MTDASDETATPDDSDDEQGARTARVHPRNQLNDLSGREWIRFTRSWFVHNPPRRSRSQILHPAKFPEALVGEFIRYFTKVGETVLDPFAGTGSTLLAACETGRHGVGVEVNSRYVELARRHLGAHAGPHSVFHDDASRVEELFRAHQLPPVDFVMTSPPYWNMLGQSRGNVLSAHKRRKASGLDVVYSESDENDLGNESDYTRFLDRLAAVFLGVRAVLRRNRYLVVVVQNLRAPEGRMVPLAWDLTARLEQWYTFKGERIWCQDNKPLGIWGYPSEYVSNVHHHYCLVFKNDLLTTR